MSIVHPHHKRKNRQPLSQERKRDVWSMTGGRCFYCGRNTNPFSTFTVDHIVPVSRGGSSDLMNLVPCCRTCNIKKGTQLLDEWNTSQPLWCYSAEYTNEYAFLRAIAMYDEDEDL